MTEIPKWLLQKKTNHTQPKWYKPLSLTNVTIVPKELEPKQFEHIFERVLEKIEKGIPLSHTLRDDCREPDYARFLRWVMKDPQRKERYLEAQEIGSEIIASDMIEISDGSNSMEDVQRSTLRVNTRKFLIGVWSKKRYGDIKQLEVSGGISITKALEEAQNRVIIDASYKEVKSIE